MPERRAWTQQEDDALKHLRGDEGLNKWSLIAKRLADDYNMHGRTGKQCRQRYHNHLDSNIMHSEWTRDQELFMYRLHDQLGNKWAIISQKLQGRTDNCVKNHFYSKLRKAIRKLNKTIHDYFRKEFKQIKITILYKIIEAADEKFKTNPTIDEEVSEKCCDLKRILLAYSNDEDNDIEGDLEKLKALVKAIYEFSSSYRRKLKRCRKGSAQINDFLKVPKFEKKVKSTASDRDESESDFSFMLSHSSQDIDESSDDETVEKKSEKRSLILENVDAIEEEDSKGQEFRSNARRLPLAPNLTSMESEKNIDMEEFLMDNGIIEGRISIPIPQTVRSNSLWSDHDEKEDYPDMFGEESGIVHIPNTFEEEDIMDDENKLFTSN